MEETKFTGLNNGSLIIPADPSIIFQSAEKTDSRPAPVLRSERIQSVDIVRGVALLGILLMNIPGFALDTAEYFEVIASPVTSIDFITLKIVFTFFEGTMRGLFSMLFGAGMILFTLNKSEKAGDLSVAEYYYRRLLWLVGFGILNAFVLLWPGDILFYYGLTGMLLYGLRKTKSQWLIVLGLLCFLAAAYKSVLNYNDLRDKRAKYILAIKAEKESKPLTDEQKAEKEAWLSIENNRPNAESRKENVTKMRSGYDTVFLHLISNNTNAEIWGMYHGIWDVLGMMLIGMGLFRLGFFSNTLRRSTYFICLLAGYGIGIPVSYYIFQSYPAAMNHFGNFVDSYRIPVTVLYDLKRLLISVGHASAIMLIIRSGAFRRLMQSVGAVGQMAFTNYLMQSIICTLIFYGYGMGYYDRIRFYQLYFIVAGIWIFQIIFSVLWLRYFRFGPFEWIWRSLTYGKRQPMKLNRGIG